ncbi:kinase-like domain-containing protein [Rhizophagus diaphanus]|nr:kinase-like domain-containing protein [Rhizophagus diaphanus] [Rhizophagus sp. MUCL 43196]
MTSVKKWIDKKIKDKQIIDYEYSKFSEIEEIGRGGFGKVQRAELADTGLVALKSFVDEYSNIDKDKLNRIDDEFVKELELLREVKYHENINCILGITKVSKSYILVLEYANEGTLRDYLKKKFTLLEWKDKTQMALDIARGLKFLHFKGIIHRDLHSKNILVNNGKLLIADLGLSKKLAEVTTNSIGNRNGMDEYIDPQCFKNRKYKKNKKSDIYSLGVLSWEISSGRPPFSDCSRNLIAYYISKGDREEPIEGTPLKYQQLYQECWDDNPESRPDIEEVYETLSQLKAEEFSLLLSPHSNINEIKNSNIDYNDDLSISDDLNSRREKYFDVSNNIRNNNIRSRSNYIKIYRFGKSGNTIIDDFILEKKLRWIPYNKFTNVKYLNEGGFGTIYKATWLNNDENEEVILKCHINLNKNLNEFLKEWEYHTSVLNSNDIIYFYGFTEDPLISRYMVVMDYANQGTLRENLTRIVKNNWNQKLYMLYQIISGLNKIHEENLIHCNFHDGNILNHNDNKIYISGLGLCKPVKSGLEKYDIYGVIPFMAPEVLRGKSYTPANGERPEIIENTPQCYVDLMKRCWNEDPLKRPSSNEVLYIIDKWIFRPNDDEINEELKSNIMEFINAPIGQHNNLVTESHLQAFYTSLVKS